MPRNDRAADVRTRRLLAIALTALLCLVSAGCAAQTDPASKVGALTATLNAHGHTDSTPAHYRFQYSTSAAVLAAGRGRRTPRRGPVPANVPDNGTDLPFSESVGGLTLGTTYYYRVCGGDRQLHHVCSNTQSFVTAPSPTDTLMAHEFVSFPAPLNSGIVPGPDGALWVTTGPTVERITTDGQLTQFSLEGGMTASPPVVGPDGAIWFGAYAAQTNSNTIDRLTTAGALSVFPLATGSCVGACSTLTVADGEIWFVDGSADIGRMSLTGTVTLFAVPPPGASSPATIVTGSDGSLWFGTPSNQIGRMTTAGAVTFFTVADPSQSVQGLVEGPGHAVWFTASTSGSATVGRLATDGTVTRFTAPPGDVGAGLGSIIAGPDGALWFEQFPPSPVCGCVNLSRSTVGGHFTFFLGSLRGSAEMTAGPDGAIWVTETGIINRPDPRLADEIHRFG